MLPRLVMVLPMMLVLLTVLLVLMLTCETLGCFDLASGRVKSFQLDAAADVPLCMVA